MGMIISCFFFMSIYEWIKLADELNVDGLEFYNNFADIKDPANWPKVTLPNT